MIPDGFKGRAKRLDDLDVPRLASEIGVSEDVIRAVLEVESRGSGFDKQGRPAMLFEPHVFYRRLGAGEKRKRAVAEGLAYPKWGEKKYPRDSYPRLLKAMEIDRAAALESASWGLAQIMGLNFEAAGFNSAEEMVAVFCDDEEYHLSAMVMFIKARGLDDELRALGSARNRDEMIAAARRFAAPWNGPGYEKNKYHIRIPDALIRWRKIPDLSFRLDHAERETEVNEPIEAEPAHVNWKQVQERLVALGYHEVGMIDGEPGTRTRTAIFAFQTDNGLPPTGEPDDATLEAMEDAPRREVAASRASGKPKSAAVVVGDAAKIGGGAVIVGGAVTEALGQIEAAKSILDRARAAIEPLLDIATKYPTIGVIMLGVGLAVIGHWIAREAIRKFRSGELMR